MRPTRMLTGASVVRVVWMPGSDRLEGTCHCGATTVADGPVEVWEWLLAHPDGHLPAADLPAPELAATGGPR